MNAAADAPSTEDLKEIFIQSVRQGKPELFDSHKVSSVSLILEQKEKQEAAVAHIIANEEDKKDIFGFLAMKECAGMVVYNMVGVPHHPVVDNVVQSEPLWEECPQALMDKMKASETITKLFHQYGRILYASPGRRGPDPTMEQFSWIAVRGDAIHGLAPFDGRRQFVKFILTPKGERKADVN
ncbi:MAG: hypothetical protein SGARI_005711, partial [Bacillariaceae sp.]